MFKLRNNLRTGSWIEFIIVNRISSRTACKGRMIGSLSSASLYGNAIVDAACMAASASTSHRALDTDAAAANNADRAGNIVMVTISNIVPVVPNRPVNDSTNGNSTTAAVAAAHKLDNAEVNGNIAADRAP
jgi:hypothetical protein